MWTESGNLLISVTFTLNNSLVCIVRGCTMLVSFLLTYLTNRVFPLKVWMKEFISMSSQKIQPVMYANAMTIQSRRNRKNNALCILWGCIIDVLVDRISHARTSTIFTSSILNTKGIMSIVSWPWWLVYTISPTQKLIDSVISLVLIVVCRGIFWLMKSTDGCLCSERN